MRECTLRPFHFSLIRDVLDNLGILLPQFFKYCLPLSTQLRSKHRDHTLLHTKSSRTIFFNLKSSVIKQVPNEPDQAFLKLSKRVNYHGLSRPWKRTIRIQWIPKVFKMYTNPLKGADQLTISPHSRSQHLNYPACSFE